MPLQGSRTHHPLAPQGGCFSGVDHPGEGCRQAGLYRTADGHPGTAAGGTAAGGTALGTAPGMPAWVAEVGRTAAELLEWKYIVLIISFSPIQH